MKVVIMCGGLGTRLREETEFRPKPMVNIGSRPILWHIMKIYSFYGFKEFILPLGYKGEMIKDYFCNYELMNNDVTLTLGDKGSIETHGSHDESDWQITLANTGINTLKGARLKRIENYIDDEVFMVTYGDGVADINISKLLDFHYSHGKMVTVTGVNPSRRFGDLKIYNNNVIAFREKPEECADNGYVNGGFFVMNKSILSSLSEKDDCDLEYGPLERIADQGEMMIYKHSGFWACMDTLRDTEYLNNLWNHDRALWKVWK